MKYGIHLPNFGGFGDAQVLVEMAVLAEAVGWDGVFLWGHLLFCEPDQSPHVDPWIALTAMAMATQRVFIGPIVPPVPRRRPWKLAREAVSLQNLSGGRLILGVGLGDPVMWEYASFHEETDAKIRAEKLDEGLSILHGLWEGQPFAYQGKHYRLEAMTFLPRPVKPIPIWTGGYWPRKAPFRRAARCDGVVPGHVGNIRLTPEHLQEIGAYIAEHRSGLQSFDLVASGHTEQTVGDTVHSFAEAGATWWLEDISPLRLGIAWHELWKPWNVDALRERVAAGPPLLAD